MDKELTELAQMNFDAALTQERVSEMEKVAQEWGVERRMMLITLARSRDQLLESFRNDPDSIMDIHDRLHSYEKHLSAALDMVKAAQRRALAVAATIHLEGQQ